MTKRSMLAGNIERQHAVLILELRIRTVLKYHFRYLYLPLCTGQTMKQSLSITIPLIDLCGSSVLEQELNNSHVGVQAGECKDILAAGQTRRVSAIF